MGQASQASSALDYGVDAETEAVLVRNLMNPDAIEEDVSSQAVRELSASAQSKLNVKVKPAVKVAVAVFVLAACAVSLLLGRYHISPGDLLAAAGTYAGKVVAFVSACIQDPSLWSEGAIPMTDEERVLFNIRLPRVLVVMLVGAALAVAGASYQGMFKNPLTSPDLLGASAGASVGACLGLLLNCSGPQVQLFAFVGGLAAVGMAVWLNSKVDYDPTMGLVLAGILVSTLFQSCMSLIKLVADANDKLPQITFWLMGSFHDVNVGDLVVFVPMLMGFAILLSQSWKLNVLSFGDEEARSMGIDTARTRLLVIVASTLLASASVAVAGIVGWIGLVVPHLARALVGPNYKVLLPASMFIGSAFLLVVDNIARLATTVEIPIGILTAILGVPFFVVIFRRNMKGWR